MSSMTVLGQVTEAERNEIKEIYMRKSTLIELSLTLADRGIANNNDLYERIIKDLAAVNERMQSWWEKTSAAHQWQFAPEDSWAVDFETRTVTLRPARGLAN